MSPINPALAFVGRLDLFFLKIGGTHSRLGFASSSSNQKFLTTNKLLLNLEMNSGEYQIFFE